MMSLPDERVRALEYALDLPPNSLGDTITFGAIVSALACLESRLWHLERKLNGAEDAEGHGSITLDTLRKLSIALRGAPGEPAP